MLTELLFDRVLTEFDDQSMKTIFTISSYSIVSEFEIHCLS